MDEPKESLGGAVQNQINFALSQLPYPIRCSITKVYDDNKHVDVTSDYGDMTYVEVIANNPTVNALGIMIFLNGSNEDFIVITK